VATGRTDDRATHRWYVVQVDLVAGREPTFDALTFDAQPGEAVDRAGATELTAGCLALRFAVRGDPGDLDRSVDLWRRSVAAGPRGPGPLWLSEPWRLIELGSVLLERARWAGGDDDLDEAISALRRAMRSTRDPLIRAIGDGRLAACDHGIYLLTGRPASARRAERRYRRAIDALPLTAPARPMLLTELGTLLQDRWDIEGDSESAGTGATDLDEALALGQEGLATGPAHGPDRACHLVNLGTCWDQRFAVSGRVDDLDRAIGCWRAAVDELPERSPYRAAFYDRLVLGLLRRVEEGGSGAQADEAVRIGRLAEAAGRGTADRPVFAGHLAEALAQRWELRGTRADLADLDTALDLLRGAVRENRAAARHPDLVANLVQLAIRRHRVDGATAGLAAAVDVVTALPPELHHGQRSAVAGAVAHLALTRYRQDGRPADLATAVAAARRALVGVPSGSGRSVALRGVLAAALHLRYEATGRRRDLDEAIAVAVGDGADPPAGDGTVAAALLDVRHDRTGDPGDAAAAVRYARDGVAAARSAADPFPGQGLAVVLHGRFDVRGRFADLDETVLRQRVALRGLARTAPARPIVLNNLGAALQDRYFYRRHIRDLAAALAAHEEAVATCPPNSPDRAGLAHTLAAAVRLRYERSGRAGDLARLVELNVAAVAAVPVRSPQHLDHAVTSLARTSCWRVAPAIPSTSTRRWRRSQRCCAGSDPDGRSGRSSCTGTPSPSPSATTGAAARGIAGWPETCTAGPSRRPGRCRSSRSTRRRRGGSGPRATSCGTMPRRPTRPRRTPAAASSASSTRAPTRECGSRASPTPTPPRRRRSAGRAT
jgi:tetratricopeptide (TPR) repeat protein